MADTEFTKHPRKVKLTTRFLDALKPAPAGKRLSFWDLESPGLALRVTDRGAKSFSIVRRVRGNAKPVRITLRPGYPYTTLAQAREQADRYRLEMARGVNPVVREAEERKAAKAKAEAERREKVRFEEHTVEKVVEMYIAVKLSNLRSGGYTEGVLRREVIPRWGSLPVHAVTRKMISGMLHELAADKGRRRGAVAYCAYHALSAVRSMFSWAVKSERYDLEASPCALIRAKDVIGGVRAKRDRVLTDAEVRAYWEAALTLAYPWREIAQLLLLTGQRLREVAQLSWPEVHLDEVLVTIGKERMKAGVAHETPVAPMALAIINELPRFEGGGKFLFSVDGGQSPVKQFSRLKDRLDAAMAKAMGPDAEMRPWVLHDVRRTMRSNLSKLGDVPDNVRELMIAHRPPGLHQVYDHHLYRAEKLAGFVAWERLLTSILDSAPATNVVPFERERASA